MKTKYRQQTVEKNVGERDQFVDVAKGIAIALVVAGHCGFPILYNITPYAFHMPFFFIVAGFFVDIEDDTRHFIIDKTKKLIIPFTKYFVFYVALALLFNNLGIKAFEGVTLSEILKLSFVRDMYLNSELIGIMTPLWFVLALYFGMLMVLLCRDFIITVTSSNSFLGGVTIIVICIVLTMMLPFGPKSIWQPNLLIGVLFRSLYVAGFLIVGKILYKFRDSFLNFRVCILFSIIFMMFYTLYPTTYNMAHWSCLGEHSEIGFSLFMLKGVFGSYIVFLISHIIKRNNCVAIVLAYMGRNSFHIMALHLLGFLIFDIFVLSFSGRELSEITNPYIIISGTKSWMYFCVGLLFPILCCAIRDIAMPNVKKCLRERKCPDENVKC